ncbi:late embryogenesis abundant protein At5g17165 [Malania oleifera]|uniref:late embryogenesis abundant protein At5g17165 n=1 Tax=Malania oleifera TaxID=397392 RepID=UPI0025ADC2B0|nr:late embryogenesis abundant protein At5g17165 [Malania oleifera]
MAANSQSRGLASFGKRFVNQIRSGNSRDPTRLAPVSASAHSTTVRRTVHFSAYDKNLDDQIRPTIVPDDVIQPGQPEKYWAPHPQTGVFGPAHTEQVPVAGGGSSERGIHSSLGKAKGGEDSVLEQSAWFRPLEDLEKPQQP